MEDQVKRIGQVRFEVPERFGGGYLLVREFAPGCLLVHRGGGGELVIRPDSCNQAYIFAVPESASGLPPVVTAEEAWERHRNMAKAIAAGKKVDDEE